MTASVFLSIVAPCFNEADGLPEFHRRATTAALMISGLSYEIVLVNDGSPDNSGAVCQSLLATATVPLIYVEHARNFGEHNAVMTGPNNTKLH